MHWTERCDCPRGATTMKRSRETSIGPRPWIASSRAATAQRCARLRDDALSRAHDLAGLLHRQHLGAQVLRDLHRAEFRPAHRAKM
ncbi:hypothetical protein OMR07_25815, partial [Methylobacterium organophilum]|nr:hypothetical protein [Methylobacterium organophilum]